MKWPMYIFLMLCLGVFLGCGNAGDTDSSGTSVDIETGEPACCADDACAEDACAGDDCACAGDDCACAGDDSSDDSASTDASTDDVSLNPPQVNEGENP